MMTLRALVCVWAALCQPPHFTGPEVFGVNPPNPQQKSPKYQLFGIEFKKALTVPPQ